MALLLVVALLLATTALVDSASNKTGCDSMPNSDTCAQDSCNQPPCLFLCGLSSPFERCQQSCSGSNCSSLICSLSVQSCLQQCPGSACKSMKCDSKQCTQSCDGGDCEVMRCPNWKNGTSCEQSFGRQMICDSEVCIQICTGERCNMTCSSSVKDCQQRCRGGECAYQCDANKCSLDCVGGICTKIKSATTPKSTTKPSGGSGTRLQVGIWLVSASMFTWLAVI